LVSLAFSGDCLDNGLGGSRIPFQVIGKGGNDMLKRIYADNYQCFVNFECQFDSLQLLMGQNGVGKTTVFNLLEVLREFIVEGT